MNLTIVTKTETHFEMEIKPKIKVEYEITLNLTEVEARALDALVGYGHEGFLKVFYEHMGKHYMKPHEAGLISLFKTVQSIMPRQLKIVDDARKGIQEGLKSKEIYLISKKRQE